ELSGLGVVAQVDGKKVVVGRKKLLDDENIPCKEVNDTALYVGVDGNFAGAITFTDTIKENAQKTIQKLHDRKIKTMIVSGDSEGPVKNTANALGVTNYHHSLFPEDKLEIVKSQKGTVAFVGDGINDAPVLAASDIGISVGTIGQDAAIEASDAVIMGDDPVRIISAIDSAKKTMRITRQNIIFVLLVKFLVLALGAAGIANMWLAVFADVGALLIAVLNTLRIIFYKCKTVEV
ncbi:MAG: HAD-IC family P-type ATPase, partial [Clostridiaceae bacterium]|nr:HAD-IC family P-type ATPase [Clostridiaceae bacterium]